MVKSKILSFSLIKILELGLPEPATINLPFGSTRKTSIDGSIKFSFN